MVTVVIADAASGLVPAMEAIIEPHGGIEAVVPRNGGTVYIDPNAVHFARYTFADPDVLEAVLAHLRNHGCTRLAVMESSTGGSFTRLVFRAPGTGISAGATGRSQSTWMKGLPLRSASVAALAPESGGGSGTTLCTACTAR